MFGNKKNDLDVEKLAEMVSQLQNKALASSQPVPVEDSKPPQESMNPVVMNQQEPEDNGDFTEKDVLVEIYRNTDLMAKALARLVELSESRSVKK